MEKTDLYSRITNRILLPNLRKVAARGSSRGTQNMRPEELPGPCVTTGCPIAESMCSISGWQRRRTVTPARYG